jgi:cellulose synthase/poly-beta-1,6-N-acetylglucosamine synthase-like glycosyltransferase
MVDMLPSGNLNTMPIVGVYINPSYPKLKVIDKINGGKADSLNVGINYSTKEYFCGIDADSLLEPDTLLKISSQFLDSDFEAVAAGGNIFPVNGCKVDKGTLTPIGICKTHLTRFQTIEYLRAFMAGRLGWSQLNSLLIISGAFGLFKKKYVIEAGGYLTSKSKYAKDTVGEDMELVVRLTKNMYIKKRKFRINYAYNANCWTEVPEDIKILYNQRNRWHRGLIDILFFHRSIIGNPKFGRIGLLAFPYFVLFEFLGPLIEASGYLMVVSAAILGFLNVNIILLLFISSILLGMVVSISSLYIAEKETSYYTIKEVLILIFYSFIENLGFRQYVSFWRVLAYFSSMGKPKGWGKMKRKGFKENKAL